MGWNGRWPHSPKQTPPNSALSLQAGGHRFDPGTLHLKTRRRRRVFSSRPRSPRTSARGASYHRPAVKGLDTFFARYADRRGLRKNFRTTYQLLAANGGCRIPSYTNQDE